MRCPRRARPTHFVAIHLKSREIQRCVSGSQAKVLHESALLVISPLREQLQQWFVAQDKLFERCLVSVVQTAGAQLLASCDSRVADAQVPIKRLHTALLLTSFEERLLAVFDLPRCMA